MNRAERRAALSSVRSTRNEWHPLERLDRDPAWVAGFAHRIADHRDRVGDLRQLWRNNVYSVQVFARATERGEVLQLACRRHDASVRIPWSDLQRIKDEVVGPDRIALEVYPRAEEVVDEAPLRHLFVLPAGESSPFTPTIDGAWT